MTKPQIPERETKNPFTVYGQERNNLFTLHGAGEDVATYAVGFALAHSRTFLEQFMENLKDTNISDKGIKGIEEIKIELQKYVKEQEARAGKNMRKRPGFTDIEVSIKGNFRLIIEAKRWWGIAGDDQLEKYANSVAKTDGVPCLMTISQAGVSKHKPFFNTSDIKIPVVHRSWQDIQNIVGLAIKNRGSDEWENILLRDLFIHLAHYVFQKKENVCIVPLSHKRKTNQGYSFQEIVTEGGGYFHPIERYPEEHIPEYLGFRWGAKLHLLHKIKDHFSDSKFLAVENKFMKHRKELLVQDTCMWCHKDEREHRIYKLEDENHRLGKKLIRSGNINHRGIQWCNFKTLQSGKYKTLEEIVKATGRAREEKAKKALRELLGGK